MHSTSAPTDLERTTMGRLHSADLLFSAYIFSVPFGSAARLPSVFPGPIGNVSSLLGAMCIVSYAVLWIIEPSRRQAAPALGVPLWLMFLGWAALTGLWSVNPGASAEGVFVLGSLIVLSVVVMSISFPRQQRDLILHALAVSAIATGAIAIFQWSSGALGASETSVDRFALAGGDPNITAASLLLPLAVASVGFTQDLQGSTKNHLRSLTLHGLAASGALIGIALTASRGGIAAAAAVIGIVLIRHGRPLLQAAALLAGGLMLFAVELPFQSRPSGLTGRASIWNIGLLTCTESCWFGSGLDTFPDRHEAVVLARPELSANQFRFEAHNIWIGSLVELGFGATLLLFAIVVLPLGMAFVVRDRLSNAAFAGLLGVVIANMFVSNVEFKYFWLALVVASIASRGPEDVSIQTMFPNQRHVRV